MLTTAFLFGAIHFTTVEDPPPFLTQWTASLNARNIAVAPSGDVYVAQSLGPVQRYDPNGTRTHSFPIASVDVAVDADNNLYVLNHSDDRVYVYDESNTFLYDWIYDDEILGIFTQSIAIDRQGDVFLVDQIGHRVLKYTAQGEFLSEFGSFGQGDGEFESPWAMAIDQEGNLYVLDGRVQKFDADGNFLLSWTTGAHNAEINAFDVAVDQNGNVYIADAAITRIQVFDSNGNYLFDWGGFSPNSGFGLFEGTDSVAVDSNGHVYVVDGWGDLVQKFGEAPLTMASNLAERSINEEFTLRTFGGTPQQPAALFLTEVSGSPFFQLFALGALDEFGHWIVEWTVPDDVAFQGLDFSMISVSLDETGKPIVTDPHAMAVDFE